MTSSTPLVDELVAKIVEINPLQAKFLEESLGDATAEEVGDLESYISYCHATGLATTYLAECYNVIVQDALRELIYFQRHGSYRYSTFAEVADSVYYNPDFMAKYMRGLAITSCLWANQRELHRFFAAAVPVDRPGAYLEVGPGHGLYMMTAMRRSTYDTYEGVDLSPTSVALTKGLLESGRFGDLGSFSVCQKDFLVDDMERESYDAIVMGEVLEHVEEPARLLERITSLVTEDGFVFITTPMNSPAIDHIYLFDSMEAIESLVRRAGLAVRDRLAVPYPGLSIDESIAQRLPVNVALVLGKAP